MATFDRNAKSNLYKVYEEIEDIVKSKHFFPEINEELTAEFGDIIKLVHKQKADVCEDICPIVITGETSAGKSTFVNLLLGVELLPQSPLTCTSPICRISNGDNKRILLTDSEDKQHNLNLADIQGVEEMRILLKDYICATEAGEKYKAVDICWPIPCLQSKIMIVDTPGISPDNDILATRLFEYLPSALAFIYIINPTNAGGVQSDRLQRILDEQERRICRGVKTVFDPRRAIFVCNKWDQMHEDEEKVFNHIKEKLSNKWTNFDSSKMYKISAWEEMQRSKNDQPISDNFKALLKGIDQMIPACLHEKIFRHASWQRYFLDRLNFKLAARMINARRTEDEKKMMAKQVMKRVQKVRENITALSRSYVRKKNLSNDIEVFVNGEWKDAAVKQMQWSYSNNANCSVLSEIQILR
ncbi:dynamin-like protein A [Mytilus galloprovincialis]|uniref:dynamin-like protein A n=1 Tax=Mytilus galloprovincialis TaxID=29158 RepID=UPI003F7C98AD